METLYTIVGVLFIISISIMIISIGIESIIDRIRFRKSIRIKTLLDINFKESRCRLSYDFPEIVYFIEMLDNAIKNDRCLDIIEVEENLYKFRIRGIKKDLI